MKVVFIAPNLHVGGVERQWTTLAPALIERGLDIEVLTLDDRGPFFDELERDGVPVEQLPVTGKFPVRAVRHAARSIARRSPHVVMTNGFSAHVVGHFASARSGAAHVAAIHSTGEPPISRRQGALLRLVGPRVDAATIVSPAQLPFVEAHGFDASVVHVIPNGADAGTPSVGREAMRAALRIDDRTFVALLVATLRPEKRADRFIDAIVRANDHDERIHGLVAGGGQELEAVRRKAEGVKAVTVLGRRDDVADLIAASDVVCLTSDAEALPLSLLEAMAGSRPTIATDVGGVPDAVEGGTTGILVPRDDVDAFADAVVLLAADPALCRRLGRDGARRFHERFTVDRMVDLYVDLFDRLVSGTSSRDNMNGGSR